MEVAKVFPRVETRGLGLCQCAHFDFGAWQECRVVLDLMDPFLDALFDVAGRGYHATRRVEPIRKKCNNRLGAWGDVGHVRRQTGVVDDERTL